MNNLRDTIVHKFFYSDGGRYYPARSSCGYNGDSFYSYYTLIAQLTTDKHGQRVLLLHNESMSTTTARHISSVWSACPGSIEILRVPFKYGEHYFHLDDIAERCINNVKYYAGQKLTQKANRENFIFYFNTFEKLKTRFTLPAALKIPAALKKLYNELINSDSYKNFIQKQKDAARKMEAAQKARFNRLIKGRKISELARLAYDNDSTLDAEQREKLRRTLNPAGELAFIWRDDAGNFKTSKGIFINAAEGERALKLYNAGKIKHGDSVGYYKVLKIMSDFVQIGCHKILTANIKEL